MTKSSLPIYGNNFSIRSGRYGIAKLSHLQAKLVQFRCHKRRTITAKTGGRENFSIWYVNFVRQAPERRNRTGILISPLPFLGVTSESILNPIGVVFNQHFPFALSRVFGREEYHSISPTSDRKRASPSSASYFSIKNSLKFCKTLIWIRSGDEGSAFLSLRLQAMKLDLDAAEMIEHLTKGEVPWLMPSWV